MYIILLRLSRKVFLIVIYNKYLLMSVKDLAHSGCAVNIC